MDAARFPYFSRSYRHPVYQFLGPKEFERRYGNIFRALFCGDVPRRASFRNDEWHFLLAFYKLHRSEREFGILAGAARSIGDEEFVITSVELNPAHRWSFVISCDWNSYGAAINSKEAGVLLGLRQFVFGTSGRWGGIIDNSYLYVNSCHTILGGERDFIDGWAAF
jgi:hypothetical protein